MRLLGRLLFSVVFLSTLFKPADGIAQEPHSWCVPGAPMVNPPGPTTDPITAKVVTYVCGQSALASCCHPNVGRWNLSCVEAAADYANAAPNNLGDVCGRYAWTQGPLAGTQQYYPRDFNLFALGGPPTTSGDVTGLVDVEGPVAVQGVLTATGFNLNWGQHEPVAMVVERQVRLTSGTISGAVYYGAGYRDTGVTYVNTTRPIAASHPVPINFADAGAKLRSMSQNVKLYSAIPAAHPYSVSALFFAGSDPELNVFSVDSSLLAGATSYVIGVGAESLSGRR